ncbi:major capsid protein [Hyphobacterium sp.]|uniref:major capsid protein n=1 Tax=Hyphobacterium sp. TaxID=2004662 RepID=UPI003BAB740F
MPLSNADTRQLYGAVETIQRPGTFLLDTFFPEIVEFDSERIDFDVISRGRKLAPFVSPKVPGRPVRTGGYQTKSFAPAYVKPKDTINPARAQRRRAGEQYMGEMSAAERLEALTMDTLDEQRSSILRRKEWMAANALLNGQVTVEGEDYPAVTVDFGRDAALTVTLGGGSQWGDAGVEPLTQLENWSGLTQRKSGIPALDVIMDPVAWSVFRKNADVKDVLDTRRGSESKAETGPIVPISEARFAGEIGDMRFWVYQDYYETEAGVETQLLPDRTVIISSPNLEGIQAHGAILDAELGLLPLEYAPKVWNEKDPSARVAMTQSAPLVVPTRVNHSFRATI